MSHKHTKQPSGSRQNTRRASPLGELHDEPMDHESTELPSAPSTMATSKRSRCPSDNDSRSSKHPPHGWVLKPFLQTVAHATGCPHCSAYIEHLSEVDSTSGSFAAAIEARNSFYADRANRGMLPGCDVTLLEDDVRRFHRSMEEAFATRDEYLQELRDQDSEIATLKEELAVAQAQLASVSIPLAAQGGRGSGGSSKPTTRGKASSFVPPTSKPPLLNKGKTFELPSAGPATLASHAKPTTTLASSTKTPATSSLPNTASKPAAVPTSEKGKGPAAPIPEKGKGKDIWIDSSPPEKLSKRARKQLNQEVNPNLFGYVTDESNSEGECDMRSVI
ncbi:hypothetical protein BV22DRAFT_1133605 [Leucogyrophana mollusca]|uniref:Uncharacterized protein n=1 Tax=Leucogyrophana mollusca TaxID=85980 RepID=A0ACB8B4G0_9AGAM|nr:hypothetical protein BV22DRAFT_1133605 [Leucogyrophana mollusca]